jgi:hypothetical protein
LALWLTAEILTAAGAVAWWWSARDDGTPRIEPRRSRATAERSVAAAPIAPEAERTHDAAVARPKDASSSSIVAAASPLLEPDRVVVVSGVVVSAADGAPIEGAEIVVRDGASGEGSIVSHHLFGNQLGDADSDEQGRYEVQLEGGVPARLRVEATAEGASFAAIVLDVERDATALRADFRLRSGFEVEVKVVRASDGAPIPFARVELCDEKPGREESSHDGETDAAGCWSERDIGDLPRHGLAVVVEAEGFAPRRIAPLEVLDEGDRVALRCELAPSRPLSGVVVAQGGGPIAEAEVELVSLHDAFGDRGDDDSTDDAGRFTLDASGMPEELASLLVKAEGWQSVRIDRPWSGGGATTIVMPPIDPPWRGRVIDRATGRGVAGCDFVASPVATGSPGQFAESGEEGFFEASLQWLPRGFPLRVTVWADGYAGSTIDLATSDDGRLTGPSVIELDRMVVIRGRVVDPFGEAEMRNAMVEVRLDGAVDAEEFAILHCRAASSDARYELELPLSLARAAGHCSIVVERDRRRFALGRLDLKAQIDRAAPGAPVEVELDLPIDLRPWWVREGR